MTPLYLCNGLTYIDINAMCLPKVFKWGGQMEIVGGPEIAHQILTPYKIRSFINMSLLIGELGLRLRVIHRD